MDRSGSGLGLESLNFEATLAHYGVRGMKWGVRRKSSGGTSLRKRLKKGETMAPSEDAARVAVSRTLAKKHGTHVLNNKDFQELVARMNLEQQYSTITTKQNQKKLSYQGQKFVLGLAGSIAKEHVNSVVRNAVAGQVKKAMAG
jgi:hypothetical protein